MYIFIIISLVAKRLNAYEYLYKSYEYYYNNPGLKF